MDENGRKEAENTLPYFRYRIILSGAGIAVRYTVVRKQINTIGKLTKTVGAGGQK